MEAIGTLMIIVLVAASIGGALEAVIPVLVISHTMFWVTSLIIEWTSFDPTIMGWIGFATWAYIIYRLRTAE